MKLENKSVMISTPCYQGLPYNDFTVALFRMFEYSKYVRKNDIEWIPVSGSNIYGIRNKTFKIFKESRFGSLLLIDNDMVFHESILECLFQQDKDGETDNPIEIHDPADKEQGHQKPATG